jgi:Immunoglobulin domain
MNAHGKINVPLGLRWLAILGLIGIILPSLMAVARSSANHSVSADTIDSGGKPTTSATYSNVGSLGPIGYVAQIAGVNAVPVIVTQPVNQTVAGSASVTFTTVVSGYPVPSFQWQRNGVDISGATGSSYTIPNVALGDAGNYTVIVTNNFGSTASNPAVLTTFVAAPSDAVISFTVE